MDQQDSETEDTESEARDAYDEFEERIRRIGIGIVAIWKELKISERVSHVIALITLIALTVYAGYTIKIYKANRESADTARRALAAQTRPWVRVTITRITSKTILKANEVARSTFTADATLQNYGTAPALNMGFTFVQVRADFYQSPTIYQQLCDRKREEIERHTQEAVAHSLFPGRDGQLELPDQEVTAEGFINHAPMILVPSILHTIGCIWYSGLDSNTIHHAIVRYDADVAVAFPEVIVGNPRLAYEDAD